MYKAADKVKALIEDDQDDTALQVPISYHIPPINIGFTETAHSICADVQFLFVSLGGIYGCSFYTINDY